MKNILIVGGSGFIGQHLYHRINNLSYTPIITSRSPLHAGYNSIQADIPDIVQHPTLLENTACIILLAWPLPSNKQPNISEYFQESLIKNMRLIETIAPRYPNIKYLFVSTGGAIYGNNEFTHQQEHYCACPISPYGISKLSMEKALGYYQRLYGIEYAIARPSNPYGIGQYPKLNQGIIAQFLNKAKHNTPIDIWGDGSITKDYLYIEDLAEGIVALLLHLLDNKHHLKHDTYNFGSGTGTSIKDIIHTIQTVTNKQLMVQYTPQKLDDITHITLDTTRAHEELSWKVSTSLEDGITKTWDWIVTL
jgi:UDP-glucose 4-epimerase